MSYFDYDASYKTDINALLEKLSAKEANPEKLVSENANIKTRELFEFLKSINGKKILSGQQYLQYEELEDSVYRRHTGKIPAVRGYDLMDMDKKKGDRQLERAIKWGKAGAIITMCWHWYAPDDMENPEECVWAFYSMRTNYKQRTSLDLLKAVEEGTPEYGFIISRIDKAAAMLRELEKEDIPVLWRPLHEASGSWFWWGHRGDNASAEAYKKLWCIMFDRLENYHKLSNLIWVWNGQSHKLAVSPNTYDIAGDDIYSELPNDRSSQKKRYDALISYTEGKLAALSECGYIPHPDNLIKDGVKWLWWLPWWGGFVYKRDENFQTVWDGETPAINEKYMTEEFIKEVFNHEYVICYEDLPWIK